jgi:hypothetical protein
MGRLTGEQELRVYHAGSERGTEISPQRHRGHEERTQSRSFVTPECQVKRANDIEILYQNKGAVSNVITGFSGEVKEV